MSDKIDFFKNFSSTSVFIKTNEEKRTKWYAKYFNKYI